MTADAHRTRREVPGRTPSEVRTALTGPDRAAFERAYQAAVAQAAMDFDLTPIHDVVDQWWQVAALTADPAAHQRTLDTAAALRAGRPVPTIPWDTLRADLGV